MADLILLRDWYETAIELWKPVEDFPDYDVSNLGNVRRWRGKSNVLGRKGFQIVALAIPLPVIQSPLGKNGRWRKVTLMDDHQRQRTMAVHRLVAKAFVSNPLNMPQVNHLSAFPQDNRASNLEWTDHAGNHLHATVNGLRKQGEGVSLSKLTAESVKQIRLARVSGEGSTSIARRYGVDRCTIKRVVNRKTWKHVN